MWYAPVLFYVHEIVSPVGYVQAMPQGALAYFNCGPVSGASQPHKHLQVIPLPLIPSAPTATPFWPNTATALASAPSWKEGIMQLSSLPFLSFIARVDEASATGALLADTHTALLQKAQDAVAAASEPLSHNLVMTKEFMMVVPRRADGTGPVSCNAMAFAGSFFVRGVDELEFIRKTGPMQILTDVGFPSHQ